MNCLKCHGNTQVVDSRTIKSGTKIRRRRRCLTCQHAFTTYELPRGEAAIERIDKITLAESIAHASLILERLQKLKQQIEDDK